MWFEKRSQANFAFYTSRFSLIRDPCSVITSIFFVLDWAVISSTPSDRHWHSAPLPRPIYTITEQIHQRTPAMGILVPRLVVWSLRFRGYQTRGVCMEKLDYWK